MEGQSERVNASRLQKLWSKPEILSPLDGFHVAIFHDKKGILVVGADLLGIFPVYYYTSKDVILVGSSPELFRYHPCFEMEVNPEGLVGILLAKGFVDGKTLLRGVRRLAAGHLLKCNSGNQSLEVAQFKFSMSTKYFNMDLSEQVEVLDGVFEEAVARQLPEGEKCCLMLSGGLDSTLLAGYLKRGGYEIVALTEGLKTDNEMKCAEQIAKTLDFKHIQFHIAYNNYNQYSDLHTTWQHLSGGFTGVGFWRFYKHLRKIAPYVVNGFAGDSVFGTNVDRSLSDVSQVSSLDTFFKSINNDAFSPSVLKKLLKKDYHRLIPKTLDKIKEIYDSYPGLRFQKAWGFGLNQRTRFHDLNGVWAVTFGAWPVLPFADHKILETVGGLPIGSLINRQVERELLRIKFPKLAKLNLAGDFVDSLPATKSFRHKLLQHIYGMSGVWKIETLREIRDLLINQIRGERRYWLRQIKFDSPEWIAVRKKAEPYIPLTAEFFYEEALKELMPSPDSKYLQVLLKMKNFGVNRTSSLKIILGLTFWLQTHFDAVTNYQRSSNRQNKAMEDTHDIT
jgi:asparagine synthase (glutamine-hydrolysing)